MENFGFCLIPCKCGYHSDDLLLVFLFLRPVMVTEFSILNLFFMVILQGSLLEV